jgi:biotin transport system substrate-specific component
MNSLADAMNRVATAAADHSVPRSLRRPLAIVLGSLLVAVCAHVSIPLWFTPVPVTLQTFAVLLLGLLLSPAVSAAALVLYLLEGAIGLPVFSPYAPPGFLHLLGPTGGYLLSYPFAAALTGLLRSRFASRGFAPSLLAAATGSLFILLCGAAWFGILTHQSAGAVLTLAILPFVAGDVLKVVAAAGVVSGIGRFRRR